MTAAQSVLHELYLEQQIEVPWILLTIQQHSYTRRFVQVLSKQANRSSLDIIDHTHQFRETFSCAPSFYTSLSQTVRIFFHVVVFFTFLTKDANL